MKEIPQEIPELIRQLLVFDNYTRASARVGAFGTSTITGTEVFLERFIHAMLSGFFSSSPFDATAPPSLRSGESPLEIHLESGAGASFLYPPGIVRAFTGSDRFDFFVPDTTTEVNLILRVYTYIHDINLRPADSIGNIDLAWHSDTQSLMLTIEFETAGTEILGDITADFDRITARLFLRPRITRGRMLWDSGAMARVSVARGGVTRSAIVANSQGFREDISRSFQAATDVGSLYFSLIRGVHSDGLAAQGVASGLADRLASIAAPYAELIGNVFLALPLRPQPQPPQSLEDYLRNNRISRNPDALGERTRFVLGVLSGYFTSMANIPLNAALGMQSITAVFPFTDWLQLANRHAALRDGLSAAWRAELGGRDLDENERNHLEEVMVPRELETFVLNHIEYAHIVDRFATYSSYRIDDGGANFTVVYDPLDHVPCMRYRVSLDVIELSSEGIADFSRYLFRALDRLPEFLRSFSIQWEVYAFHDAFDDKLDESTWDTDASGVMPGAQLVQREIVRVPFSGLINGLAGLLSKELYLEWSTAPDRAPANAKLLIVGTILATASTLRSQEFRIVVPMTPAIGLYTMGSTPVPIGAVDNVVTFQAEDVPGQFLDARITCRIVARLEQKPFAQHYEWINVEIRDMSISSERAVGRLVQLEARLNGVTFQASRPTLLGVTGLREFPLITGWSRDIVYDRTSVAESFELTLVLRVFEADSFETFHEITIAERFFRFSTGDQRLIRASDTPLESAIEQAIAEGAVLEWGLPIGIPEANLILADDNEHPQLTVTVRISKPNLTRTPPEFATKELLVEFQRARLTEATPGFGADEVAFFPHVEVTRTVEGREVTTHYPVNRTRQFELNEGDEVLLPGPPNARDVKGHPDNSTLRISCFGREYDFPPWDFNDSLGMAEVIKPIPIDSSIDGIASAESHGPDGSFEMFVDVTTTSRPPKARLTFRDMPEGIDFLVSARNATVTLEYAAGWADRIFLMQSSDPEGVFSVADSSGDLVGTFRVSPAATMYYKIRSVSASQSEDSRALQVFVLA